MNREEFEDLVDSIGFLSVPEKFRKRIRNVALIVEDKPSAELRKQIGLSPRETLLGFYHGVPQTARGDMYGIGMTLPDQVIVFREPILAEAKESGLTVEQVVRETIWHEIGHHFGLDEESVRRREDELGHGGHGE